MGQHPQARSGEWVWLRAETGFGLGKGRAICANAKDGDDFGLILLHPGA